MDKFKPEQLQFSDVAISHFSGLLKKEKVNSISFIELIKKYSISNLDLLMIDAEGYDGNIVIDFLSILHPFVHAVYCVPTAVFPQLSVLAASHCFASN